MCVCMCVCQAFQVRVRLSVVGIAWLAAVKQQINERVDERQGGVCVTDTDTDTQKQREGGYVPSGVIRLRLQWLSAQR